MSLRKVCCFTNLYEGFITAGVKATWAPLEQVLLFHWLAPACEVIWRWPWLRTCQRSGSPTDGEIYLASMQGSY